MAASRTLQIIILAKDLASKSFRKIGRSLKTFRTGLTSAQQAVFGLKGAVAGLAATVGVTLLAKSFLDAAVTAERYRMQLKILTGSTKKANELFEEGADLAAGLAYEYEHVMGTIVTLRGVMKGGNEEVIKWTKLTADVAAASGADIQTATSQIVRMYSAGAASADYFREKGILAMLGFTAGVHYTAKETRRRLVEMWEDPTSKIHNAAEEMAGTWTGMVSMMSDSWFQFRQLVMEKGGIFDYMKAIVDLWLGFIKRLKSEGRLEEWALSMGQIVVDVIGKIVLAAGYAIDVFRGWAMIWLGLKKAALAFGIVINTLVEILLSALQGMISAYQMILKLQAKIGDAVQKLGQKLQAAAAKIPLVSEEVKRVATTVAALGKAFADDTREGISGLDEWKKKIEDIKGNYEDADDLYLKMLDNTQKELLLLAQSVPYHERVKKLLEEITALAEKYRKERQAAEGDEGGTTDTGEPGADAKTRAKVELAQFKAETSYALAYLDDLYKEHIVSIKRYYEEKRRLATESVEAEIAAQQKLLQTNEVQDDPNKRLQVEQKIAALRLQLRTQLLQINADEREDEQRRLEGIKQAAKIVDDITARASTTGEFGLASQFASEIRDMENRQREEMDRLIELKKEGLATIGQIEEAHRQQQIEKDKLIADQRYRLVNEYLNKTKESLGFIGDAFGDMYEASGKKIKAFFEIQKAAAIAQTIISTYQAAQDAYKSVIGLPYVGPALAVAAAAAAIAAGLARVEAIRRQEMASGGKVKGASPHPRADNIDIKATAGEYMHPVSSVKYYGENVMDAIRSKRIPREVFSGWLGTGRFKVPRNAYGYAAGGPIAAGAGGGTSLSATTNVNLPAELDFLTGRLKTEVEDTVVRVLREELSY